LEDWKRWKRKSTTKRNRILFAVMEELKEMLHLFILY